MNSASGWAIIAARTGKEMDISRRAMLGGAAALAVAGPVTAKAVAKAKGGDWFGRAIVIDALGSVGDPYVEEGITRWGDRAYAETMATGVTAVSMTVMPVGNVADAWGDYGKTMVELRSFFAANPDRMIHVRSAADILKAKREKKFAVILNTQDTSMIGPELDRLAQLKKDGVGTVQLTYNNRNLAGDGALEPANAGLSKLGRATIERIEGEKLLLDLSHGGQRTMAEGAAMAKRPLVISHTGARALYDHVRNTDDATIKAVADKGGVVGVYFMPFLAGGMKPSGDQLVAHIEHVARIAGEDHVGIGTDNGVLPIVLTEESRKGMRAWQADRLKKGIAAPGEGPDFLPLVEEYNSIDRYRRLAGLLVRRGWSVGRVEKLMGGNFLRVYREAWGG